MGIANVLLRLASKGIKPMMKNVGSKTVLSYKNGEKHLVQMFDEAGNLEKFKIHAKDGIFGTKTITKGTRTTDPIFHDITTTKVKKEVSFPNILPEGTKVVSSEIVPGSKAVRITKSGSNDVTEVTSTRSWDGSHFGEIKRNGYVEQFDTSKTAKSPLDYDNFGFENNNYGFNPTGMYDDLNYGIGSQMKQQDDDILGILGLGVLGGLI